MAVAASSSFQDSSDMRLRRASRPRSATTRSPTSTRRSSIDSEEQRLDVRRRDRDRARRRAGRAAAPSRNYYSSTAAEGTVRGFFEGEATSEVGRRTRFGGDLWTAMRPDLARYDDFIDDAPTAAIAGGAPATRRSSTAAPSLQGLAIRNLADAAILEDGPPVDFRVNVNPFVIWIWIGGAIGVIGAPDRDLARARGAPAPGLRRLRRTPRPRPRARLAAASAPMAIVARAGARRRAGGRSSSRRSRRQRRG